MSKVRMLHDEAMQWAEKAMVARRQGEKTLIVDYSEKAFRLEAEAAALIPNEKASEPTRSILYCSAASLAFEAKCFEEAERLAIQGLAGFPSQRIKNQLKEIYEKVGFESHLTLNGIEIDNSDCQLTLQGQAVASGFVLYEYFKTRVEALQNLIERTTQRLMDVPYIKGNVKKELKPFSTGLSVAREGSYSVTVKLMYEKQTQFIVTPEKVINEIIFCVNEINDCKESSLRDSIKDNAYYNSFITMTKRLAPDGTRITGVGLTSQKSRVGLTRKNSEIPFPSSSNSIDQEEVSKYVSNLVGTLDLASARGREYLGLTTETGGRHYRLSAEEGLDEYVKSYYKQKVIVSGSLDGEYIRLTDLRAA